MINFIKGTVVSKSDGILIMETGNGLGYEIKMTERTLNHMKLNKNEIVYVSMIVRDDDISLYGFDDIREKNMFKELIKVSGIGAKGALSLLNELPATEIRNSIVFQRPEELSKANGIGKKTAQRIVLELGEKMGKIDVDASYSMLPSDLNAKAQVLEALVSLGYSRAESMAVMITIDDENLSIEEYIKHALQRFK